MIDADAFVRAYLAEMPAIQTVFGSRIWASLDPPNGYTPTTGPGVVFIIKGGELDTIWKPDGEFLVYATTEKVCRDASGTLITALHQQSKGIMRLAFVRDAPTLLRNPDTGWLAARTLFGFTFVTSW